MRVIVVIAFIACLNILPAWAIQKECFKCHSQKNLIKSNTHLPVKQVQCLRCHLPHVSRYPKLLIAQTPTLCYQCHQVLAKQLKEAPFVHTPVAKGGCKRCHEAHSSPYKKLLSKKTKELCFSCHQEVKKRYARPHPPFAQGQCLQCHEAHWANNQVFLKRTDSSLCLRCHQQIQTLAIKHKVKRIQTLECLSCHDPHGGQKVGILRSFKHKPYTQGQCQACHSNLKAGPYICFKCHPQTQKDFYHQHNHLLGGYVSNACLICHAPHVAGNKQLLRDKPQRLCQQCHVEIAKQRAESLYIHPKWKECLSCHIAHGSDSPSMLNGDGNSVCVRCHETQGKFTHPVGPKVRDPRNKQPVTCVTCHNPMGTNFKYNLRLSGEASLCLECHKNY